MSKIKKLSMIITYIIKLMLTIFAIVFSRRVGTVMGSPQVTAIFAFGDSLTDPGNNNFLNSLAKANYIPYGVDFDEGPSGRFCNGKTAIDYIGELLGNPILPAYASPFTTWNKILRGVNYASAAGGILEETGRNLGERFSLSQQVENFEMTLNQLRRQTQMRDEEMSIYLSKALVIMSLGSNDYINNYLQPNFYTTSYIYTPKDYADLLISRYTSQILVLRSLGLRKFFLGGIGPLGCIPNQLAVIINQPSPGKCVDYTNNVVGMFNSRLLSLVDRLNNKYNDSVFAYANIFGAFMDILNNANIYGFGNCIHLAGLSVTDTGCCGIGRNSGQVTCLPFSVPCSNRSQYVFWDAFHPTQAVNKILAGQAYSGSSSDCYPINLQQMALV